MKKLVLHIYDWLSARKGLAIFLMAVLLGLCTQSALRMHYEEDISAFLPQSAESKRYSDVYRPCDGCDDGFRRHLGSV